MFESEIIVWLQSHASDDLTAFMRAISRAGDGGLYRLIAIAVIFGFNARVGGLLLLILLTTAFATELLKDLVALPRPAAVDSDVLYLASDTKYRSPFPDGDADGFFDLPDEEAIRHVRLLPDPAYGFPSGHVGRATALMLGAALLLRSRWLAVFAAVFVPLMAVSRMYLGAHFLADVLGGILLGSAVAVVVSRTLVRHPRYVRGWPQARAGRRETAVKLGLAGLFLVMPLAFVSTPLDEYADLGRLAAASVARALMALRGVPLEGGSIPVRAARVAIAIAVYAVASNVFEALLDLAVFHKNFFVEYVAAGVPLGICLLATTPLAIRLGLQGSAYGCAAADLASPETEGRQACPERES